MHTDAADGQKQLFLPFTPDQLADHLESSIISGRWAPGTKLPSERQLSLQYHLSRPTVREGLRRIQERGLILVQPGRGSFVREHRPTGGLVSVALGTRRNQVTARQLARARQMLESETAALAAEHRTELDISQMRSLLDRFDSATDTGSSIGFDLAFHEAIAVASRNVVLQLMFGSIRALTQGLMLRSLTDRTVRGLGAPLHRTILDAIERQDAEAARRVMREHLHIAEDHYGADIDEPMDDMLRRWASHLPEIPDAPNDPSVEVRDSAASLAFSDSPR
jgi:GntR family transcriptional repressor for pyruvate dehydrogenase complex